MGVVWEWGSHYWGSLEFPLTTGENSTFFARFSVEDLSRYTGWAGAAILADGRLVVEREMGIVPF